MQTLHEFDSLLAAAYAEAVTDEDVRFLDDMFGLSDGPDLDDITEADMQRIRAIAGC